MSNERPIRSAPRPVPPALALVAVLLAAGNALSQDHFTRITDPAHPIVQFGDVPNGSFAGASWVDVNGDGWIDLYPSGRPVFLNQGGGVFTADSTGFVRTQPALGNTWADVDNDGHVDLWQCGAVGKLWRNLGTGGADFELVTVGAAGDTSAIRGFSAAFGDYDADGHVDLFQAHFAGAGGLAGSPTRNHLLHNEGGTFFTDVVTTPATDDTTTHIMPSWVDFDLDGDLDLTVGVGPISTVGPDDFYENRLVDDGTFSLLQLTAGDLVTDLRDGQGHAWIDYDNDGDLDVSIINFRGGAAASAGWPNDLYRNDGGTFVRMTEAEVGLIVSDNQRSTGQVWADFDNDGWIDQIVSNDRKRNKYYRNDGDGTFTRIAGDPITGVLFVGHYGASAADYDRDGDLDVYIAGGPGASGLFRNEIGNLSGNHWLNLRLEGTLSNRSAIGAQVRLHAVIDGAPMWQWRQVASLASSPGGNSLNVAFGLGDAAVADTVEIRWPSGQVQVLTGVTADQFLDVVEPAPVGVSVAAGSPGLRLSAPYPSPFRSETRVTFELPQRRNVKVEVVDVTGRKVRRLLDGSLRAGAHVLDWDARDEAGRPVAAGIYFVRLRSDGVDVSRKVVRVP